MSAQQFIQTVIGGLAIGCIYSLIALGISMIIRATEILHFAQGEILMIGAMTGLSALWMTDLPFVLVLAIGMIGGGVAALAIELSVYRTLRSLRVPLINIVVSTLGISLILQNVARLVGDRNRCAILPCSLSAVSKSTALPSHRSSFGSSSSA